MPQQMDAPLLTAPGFTRPQNKGFQLKGPIGLSLAICQSDFKLAKTLMEQILLCEPMSQVELVISIAGGTDALSDEEGWFSFHNKAVSFFKKVHINRVRDIRPQFLPGENLARDWRPNNNMFRGVVDYFQSFAPHLGAFYYLEPDCAILKKDWWTQLTGEYQNAKRPFMGVIRESKAADGQLFPSHMNGSGFYPCPLVEFSQSLYAASMNPHPNAFPFDVAGGGSVTPQCHKTKLLCIDFTPTPQINPEAVVFHGDKSGNLKYSMVEKWGGSPAGYVNVQESQKAFEALKQNTLTEAFKPQAMPALVDPNLSEPNPVIYGSGQTAKPTAYESYLHVLRLHGQEKASWMRAVATYNKEMGIVRVVKEKKGKTK